MGPEEGRSEGAHGEAPGTGPSSWRSGIGGLEAEQGMKPPDKIGDGETHYFLAVVLQSRCITWKIESEASPMSSEAA